MNEELIQSFTAYTNALEQKISALEQRVTLLESRLSANSQTDQDVVALLGQLQERVAQVEDMSSKAAAAAVESHKDYVVDEEEDKPEVEVELIVDDTPEAEEEPQEEPAKEEHTEEGHAEEIVEEEVAPVAAAPVVQPQPAVEQPEEKEEPKAQPAAKEEKPKAKEEPKAAPTQTSLFGAPVRDIRQAISLGDRFLFQRELFAGNGEKMQKTLDELNALDTLDEALEYIRTHFDWDKDATAAQLFENVLRRRF